MKRFPGRVVRFVAPAAKRSRNVSPEQAAVDAQLIAGEVGDERTADDAGIVHLPRGQSLRVYAVAGEHSYLGNYDPERLELGPFSGGRGRPRVGSTSYGSPSSGTSSSGPSTPRVIPVTGVPVGIFEHRHGYERRLWSGVTEGAGAEVARSSRATDIYRTLGNEASVRLDMLQNELPRTLLSRVDSPRRGRSFWKCPSPGTLEVRVRTPEGEPIEDGTRVDVSVEPPKEDGVLVLPPRPPRSTEDAGRVRDPRVVSARRDLRGHRAPGRLDATGGGDVRRSDGPRRARGRRHRYRGALCLSTRCASSARTDLPRGEEEFEFTSRYPPRRQLLGRRRAIRGDRRGGARPRAHRVAGPRGGDRHPGDRARGPR